MSNKSLNNELQALISLLDEPSGSAYDKIKEKILFYGSDAIPYLEKAWDNSFDTGIQERIEDLIHRIQLSHLKDELRAWKKNDHLDLFLGFFLASKYQYPDLSQPVMNDWIEKIKKDIWLELNSTLTALEKVKVVNHILFDVYRFTGNKTNIDAPQNLFLNNLIETRKGNNLSLGILYIILSQRLGIPVFGVNLPQHFILAYVDEVQEERLTTPDENEVLFYINPFNKGAVFTKREIELFTKHLKLKPDPVFYKPCDNVTIIRRLFENIIHSFSRQGFPDKVEEIRSMMKAL